MSRCPINPNGVSVTKVMLVIAANPGLTTEQISERTGLAVSYVHKVQRVASEAGWIGCVPIDGLHAGRGRGWYAAADLDAARKAWAMVAERRLLERSKKGLAKLRERKEPAMNGPDPVQRTISAKSKRPLPFVVVAPNSVFAMGGG